MATDDSESTMTTETASEPTGSDDVASAPADESDVALAGSAASLDEPASDPEDAEPAKAAASSGGDESGLAVAIPVDAPETSSNGSAPEPSDDAHASDRADGSDDAAGQAADAFGGEADDEPAEGETEGAPDDAEGEPESSDDSPEITVEGSESTPRKRRRRRRKRRQEHGGEKDSAGSGEASASPESTSDEAASSSDPSRDRRERPAFSPGDQVFGKVSQVTEQSILVDIAGKATGLFDLSGWTTDPPKVGDQFIAKVQSCSMRGGMVMLVTEPTAPADARARLRQAAESSEPVEGWVTGVIKGGIEVDFDGVRAFGPASHVDLRPGADLAHLLGQRLPFMVTQYAKKGRDIVVSRKAMLEQQAEQQRGEMLATIKPDTECQGVVRRVLNWGVFVTLPEYGDVEGVIHMSEASHDRGAKLPDLFRNGQALTVKVLRVDDKGKLWLSRRAVEKDPWDDVGQKYPVGSRHKGRVVRMADFGAFIQLEPGVDGLCHVSDLSFQPLEHPSEAVSIGAELDVIVANLDPHAHKIGLHPAPPEDEQGEARPRLQPNQVVSVVVVQAKEGGLAVRIVGLTGRAQRGFIPSGQTGTPRGTELRKVFPVGKRFDAKVLDVDSRKGESKLSIRALKDDAEREAYRQYRRKVQKEATFGTLGDLLKKS